MITQNVDDLHERAGSSHVLHLHGELMKVRSLRHPERVYTLPCDKLSDKGLETSVDTVDDHGDHVRPHIVFFGEDVPNFGPACELAQQADVMVVIGTSLVVYPAAGLVQYFRGDRIVLINKGSTSMDRTADLLIQEPIGQVLGQIQVRR